MRKLTGREIILINILLIVVIFYFGILKLVMPLYVKVSDNQIYYEQLKIDEAITRKTISMNEKTKETILEKMDEYRVAKLDLSAYLHKDTIVQIISRLCIQNEVIPRSIYVQDSEFTAEEDEEIPNNIIRQVVIIKASGQILQFANLIDKINGINYISIRKVAIVNEEEGIINLELGVYMCND